MSSEEKEKPSPSPNLLMPEQSEKQDSPSITSTGNPSAIEVKEVSKPVTDDLEPVSFFGLFKSVFISAPFYLRPYTFPRYSTRKEITLNALTLIAAVGAGASQVCFSVPQIFFWFHLPYSSPPD